MKRVRQPLPPIFLVLGGLLLFYLLLPLAGLLPRVSIDALGDWLHPDVLAAVAVSTVTATVTSVLLTLFGVPLAYVLARRDFRGKTLATLLVQLPLAVPPVVSGILLLMIFGPYAPVGRWLSVLGLPPLTDNLPAIVAAQAFVASPYLIIAARTAFEEVDPTLEQVATTFGKSQREIFRRITLPLAWPAIRSGITLAWVRALGEFGATAMVAYHPHSLPVLAWVQFSESGLDSTVPLVLLMLVVGAAGVGLSYLLARPRWSAARYSSAPTFGAYIPLNKASPEDANSGPVDRHHSDAAPIHADIVHDLGDFRLDAHFQTSSQRVAILGPSGSGKSLFLKVLAGLLQPDGGHLTVGGRRMFNAAERIWLRPDERRVGYVPQHFALFPHMTVWQNVLFATQAETAGTGRVVHILQLLGLDGLSGHYPNQLSFGQQQRVALARALVRQPDYLLLDEPFASLDTPLRLHLRRELLLFLRRLDLPVVLVTHDPHEAYELVEEVVVMADGRVLQHGKREHVFSYPCSARVAALLGYRNTFHGRVLSSTPDAMVIEYQMTFLRAPAGPHAPGTTVDFFVNPDGLILVDPADPESSSPGTVLNAVVDAVSPYPTGMRLVVSVGAGTNQDYWEIERIRSEYSLDRRTEGTAVRVFVPQAAVHVMGAEKSATEELYVQQK